MTQRTTTPTEKERESRIVLSASCESLIPDSDRTVLLLGGAWYPRYFNDTWPCAAAAASLVRPDGPPRPMLLLPRWTPAAADGPDAADAFCPTAADALRPVVPWSRAPMASVCPCPDEQFLRNLSSLNNF